MGEVIYILMRKIIQRRITTEVLDCVDSYRKKADAVDRTNPACIEQLLSLSIQLEKDCKQIALKIRL